MASILDLIDSRMRYGQYGTSMLEQPQIPSVPQPALSAGAPLRGAPNPTINFPQGVVYEQPYAGVRRTELASGGPGRRRTYAPMRYGSLPAAPVAPATPASGERPAPPEPTLVAPNIAATEPQFGVAPEPRTAPAALPRQTSFDLTNTNRTTGASSLPRNPNVNYVPSSAPLPAAPRFGGVSEGGDGGPAVYYVTDPATDPTNPTSRNFDPRAAKLALQQAQVDTARANALTDATARVNTANIGANADMARTSLAGQFGLQERGLANEGELARTDLAGQYQVNAAMQAAIANMEKARLEYVQKQNDPESLSSYLDAQLKIQQLLGIEESGARGADRVGLSLKGQRPAATVLKNGETPLALVSPSGQLSGADEISRLISDLELNELAKTNPEAAARLRAMRAAPSQPAVTPR